MSATEVGQNDNYKTWDIQIPRQKLDERLLSNLGYPNPDLDIQIRFGYPKLTCRAWDMSDPTDTVRSGMSRSRSGYPKLNVTSLSHAGRAMRNH